jgi:glycosyltransferase involved in cell wall biosynthesis
MSVSVVITCHDEERTIEQAVRSIEAQTTFDSVDEIVVVNDGSRDGSGTVLDRLAGEVDKLRIIETPGLGLPAARNRGLREVKGEFVGLLDGDDFWRAEKLERQLPAFGRSGNIGLVYGDFVDFSRDDAADGRWVTVRRFDPESPHHLRDYFAHDGPIMPSTVVLRRSVLEDVGFFDESLRVGEDTEFWLRVAEKWRFCHVPGAFTFKRRHSAQISTRLDVLLPNAARVTQRFATRHSELRALADRRMARLHAKVSADCAMRGEWREALLHDITAIRLAPLYWRAWANVILLLAPASVVRPFYERLKRPWHALRHSCIPRDDPREKDRMRILYVLNGFDPGGAEHGLVTLVESGAFEDHDLRVLAFCRGRGDLADRIDVTLGKRIQFVTHNNKLTFWACSAGFFSILRTAFAFRPQKIVLSLKQANVVGRSAAILMPRLTCVAFEHTAEYRARRFRRLYGPVLHLLSTRVDEVWADCKETLDETRRYFVPRARPCHVIPLFVAESSAPFKTDYASRDRVRLAAAGRLITRKNVPLMVAAVDALRREGVDVTLAVYGEGPEKQAIEALLMERGLQDHVTLHGYRADWVKQATTADIFLNLSEAEGFCIVVAEAMLAGLPVIAVDVGGIRDYGLDGENMLKLSSADAEGARAAILRLMMDQSLRERLGLRARADMLRGYDAVACRQQVAEALSSP